MSGWVAGAVVVGTVAAGYMQAEAAKSAAQKQADAAARAQGQLLATGDAAADLYNPYTTKGIIALNKISDDPYFTHQFNNQDLNATLAPGYDFRLKQGQQANLQAANASGGAVSGNALRGLQDYSQNFASGEYANAFNQYQAQRSNIYSNLQNIANMGLTGTQGQANAALGTGTNIANITSATGNAQAASQIAQGNAYASMAGGASNAAAYYGLSQMNNANAMQSQLSAGGYGSNAYNNFTSNPSTNPASTSFIGPVA
jgi:hypothetical protein